MVIKPSSHLVRIPSDPYILPMRGVLIMTHMSSESSKTASPRLARPRRGGEEQLYSGPRLRKLWIAAKGLCLRVNVHARLPCTRTRCQEWHALQLAKWLLPKTGGPTLRVLTTRIIVYWEFGAPCLWKLPKMHLGFAHVRINGAEGKIPRFSLQASEMNVCLPTSLTNQNHLCCRLLVYSPI